MNITVIEEYFKEQGEFLPKPIVGIYAKIVTPIKIKLKFNKKVSQTNLKTYFTFLKKSAVPFEDILCE